MIRDGLGQFIVTFTILLITSSALDLSQAASSQVLSADSEIELIWGAKIPMRDGVKLNATVYRPKHVEAQLPVIFALTPYTADTYHDRAIYFAQNGYVFALVESRGRGNSEGLFEPYANEERDGYDIVEWLARQPWSNGKVAMWGLSYSGFDQWSTLKELPPHLETITPAASVCPSVDFPFLKNIFYTYMIRWPTATSGVTMNWNLFGDSPFWYSKYRELFTRHLPFKDLDKVVGNNTTYFQKWLKHPTPDAYWEAMIPTVDQYRQIDRPILTITGQYDDTQRGAMHYYRMHMRYGSEKARPQHYLIIGPWDHGGTLRPKKEFGGLTFGEGSLIDMNKLLREWYDWTMKAARKPELLKKQVAYYVIGAEEWRYADSLDAIPNTKRVFYLNSNGHANDAFQSGILTEEKPGRVPPDKFTYDPLDNRPAYVVNEDIKNYLTDQREALNLFGQGLVYHSEPFAEDTEIIGHFKFVAWIAMDVPDTDFQVSVYEIIPDGTSIILGYDLVRARYRESLKQERLVEPGEVGRYEFNLFPLLSRRIPKGSRLRVVLRSPTPMLWEKNYNAGGVVAEESGKDARTANITVYHSDQYPSFLEVPLTK